MSDFPEDLAGNVDDLVVRANEIVEERVHVLVEERIAAILATVTTSGPGPSETPEPAVYEAQGAEFPPGARVRLAGRHRQPGEASVHGMIATDAPPQEGVVVGHDPAVWPHTERRHRVRMDDGTCFTTDFVELVGVDR